MSKLSRSRKREIREKVREAVACEIRDLDAKVFENIAENEEEQAYVMKEREEIAARINYKPTGDSE